MAGFVARDIARGLRRADELKDEERRRRTQDVADKFAQVRLGRETADAARDPKRFAHEDWQMGREQTNAAGDDQFRTDQQSNTRTVWGQQSEDRTRNIARDRAGIAAAAAADAERSPYDVDRILGAATAEAAAFGKPLDETEITGIRSAAARAAESVQRRDLELVRKSAAGAWSEYRNAAAVEQWVGRLASTFASEHPGTDRASVEAELRAIADAQNPQRIAQARVDEQAVQDAALQNRVARLEEEFNNPATSGIRKRWIEAELRDMGARVEPPQTGGTASAAELEQGLARGEFRDRAVPDVSPFTPRTGGIEVTGPGGERSFITGSGSSRVSISPEGGVTSLATPGATRAERPITRVDPRTKRLMQYDSETGVWAPAKVEGAPAAARSPASGPRPQRNPPRGTDTSSRPQPQAGALQGIGTVRAPRTDNEREDARMAVEAVKEIMAGGETRTAALRQVLEDANTRARSGRLSHNRAAAIRWAINAILTGDQSVGSAPSNSGDPNR